MTPLLLLALSALLFWVHRLLRPRDDLERALADAEAARQRAEEEVSRLFKARSVPVLFQALRLEREWRN